MSSHHLQLSRWQRPSDAGAVSRRGADVDRAAEGIEPVGHVGETRAFRCSGGVEAFAVVLDLEPQPAASRCQSYSGARGSGIFLDVLQRLETAEVDRRFDVL